MTQKDVQKTRLSRRQESSLFAEYSELMKYDTKGINHNSAENATGTASDLKKIQQFFTSFHSILEARNKIERALRGLKMCESCVQETDPREYTVLIEKILGVHSGMKIEEIRMVQEMRDSLALFYHSDNVTAELILEHLLRQ